MLIGLSKATHKELEFICQVCKSTEEIYSHIMPGAFSKQGKKYEKFGLPIDYDIHIIKNGEVPIGFLGLTPLKEDSVYLVALYILKEYYRQNYGTETIDYLCNELKEKGVSEIVLQAHVKAIWALNFYKKNGFREISREEEHIQNIIMKDTVIMSKCF